ncbi:MAG: right-handed parallel beta-helix repeat-containing protein [Candidatus Bathyarchaeota archaeon]|nr:right-handed parallel beta-helix repeat-containing protein [Candidatus Bathyarchaeota archaeon]
MAMKRRPLYLIIALSTVIFLLFAVDGTFEAAWANPFYQYDLPSTPEIAPPIITIHQPAVNQTYRENNILLYFTVIKPDEWFKMYHETLYPNASLGKITAITYSVDGKGNVTIPVNDGWLTNAHQTVDYSVNLTGLFRGYHTVTVSAEGTTYYLSEESRELHWMEYYQDSTAVQSLPTTVGFNIDAPIPSTGNPAASSNFADKCIASDGTVEGTDQIQRDGDVYRFKGNISGSIMIEKDNIVLDGAGYTLLGTGSDDSKGILLVKTSNVTVTRVEFVGFECGVWVNSGSNNQILQCRTSVSLHDSFNNTVAHNEMLNNPHYGVYLVASSNNTIRGNLIAGSPDGVDFTYSLTESYTENNTITQNTIANTTNYAIFIGYGCRQNTITQNNFLTNRRDVGGWNSGHNIWSQNYWSNQPDGSTYKIELPTMIHGNYTVDYDYTPSSEPYAFPEPLNLPPAPSINLSSDSSAFSTSGLPAEAPNSEQTVPQELVIGGALAVIAAVFGLAACLAWRPVEKRRASE